MALTPYDWNQSLQTRLEFVEERLRDGSPVVAIGRDDGIYVLSVHRTRRKIFEIYDRLLFAGIGAQSDLETMRTAAIDFAHREGYTRSPDDVTGFRLVSSALSPALKRAYGDPFTAPLVFRGLFGELGETPAQDSFYTLGFDGDFRTDSSFSVVAGSLAAENRMLEVLHAGLAEATERESTLRLALKVWGTGRLHSRSAPTQVRSNAVEDELDDAVEARDITVEQILRDEISAGTVEVAFLDRMTHRESKFRLLTAEECAPLLAEHAHE